MPETIPTAVSPLRRVPLHEQHLVRGAKMVPFAGYEMPVQYAPGLLKEHLHVRASAGLFDVSHMGQMVLRPRSGNVADAAKALERIVPADIASLAPGRQRYTLLTTPEGGIIDDLMVANFGTYLFLVVNASRKDVDEAHLRAALSDACEIEVLHDRALLALQGPRAEAALIQLSPDAAKMKFMDAGPLRVMNIDCFGSRSGYTGEDGFEISVPAAAAPALFDALLANPDVQPAGLGARDSLRLEAGLCLYGNDIDETTSPVEAGLEWSIQKSRRTGGARAGGFPGAERILTELQNGVSKRRVGLRPESRPIRAGASLYASETATEPIGRVTSGGFGATCNAPVSMGYAASQYWTTGTRLFADVGGKRYAATVADLPFVPHSYKR
jgi:aminomethyltransferase